MQELYQEEYEDLSLKLLAMQMYGEELKGLKCGSDGTCKDSAKNNCKMDIDHEQVYYHEALEIDINTCPLNCILSGHYSFWDDYIYYTEGTNGLPQNKADCDANLWRLWKAFTRHKNTVLRTK